jgi:arylsulfatase A-like enzyme
MTPFRNEKNSNWEGAYRVPAIVRWPGKIKAGSVSNEIVSHLDWLPTFIAMAGEPGITEKLLTGHKAGNKTFKVHLDGYNLLPYLTGAESKSPRPGFFYFSDDGDLTALRYDHWKLVFMEQRVAVPYASGRSPSCHSAYRKYSTCAPIRTSEPTSPQIPITTGCSTTPSWSCRRRL